ncbi:MAG: hypothetical protein ABI837_02510 [Acidobacteriota bacterium]
MTRGALVVGLTLFLATQAGALRAQDASSRGAQSDAKLNAACKQSSLNGYYIYAQDGFVVSGTEASQRTPFAQAGREYFDGSGHMSGLYTASLNGKITSGKYSGTYVIGADCAGTVTFTDNLNQTYHFDIYSVDGGDEFSFIQTDPGIVSSAFERRRAGFGRN